MLPQSRTNKLLIQELDEELLVYDQENHKAHRLNATSGFVWQHCNGKRTVSQLAALLQRKENVPVGEDVVLLALKQLEKASLMRPNAAIKRAASNISRRQLILSAAIALPIVTTILVPTPAAAASQEVCCVCKGGNTGGNSRNGEQGCITLCGSTGVQSFTPGKEWDEKRKRCV